jgi:hypothetical protein
VCGGTDVGVARNVFKIGNANPLTALVHWKVQNNTDEGTVVLPPSTTPCCPMDV